MADDPTTTAAPCRNCVDLAETLRRVVANEGNHYDRYWTPAPEPVTDEWLADTEAKMREALTDAFCDDAAAVMLTLIAEVRKARRKALNEAWQAVDRAVRPLGTEYGQSRWNAGYTQARDEAQNAILELRDRA